MAPVGASDGGEDFRMLQYPPQIATLADIDTNEN